MLIKSSKQKVFVIVLIVSIMLLISGCGAINTLTSLKEKFRGDGEPTITIDIPQENQFQEVPIASENPVQEPGETIFVQLWFSDSQGQKLIVEEREINKVEGIARATINELIKGPSMDSDLLPTIPVGTVLKDINVKSDGLIIVDFSKELITNHIGGTSAETLTVYSIVNTLTQFPTVDRVQFLVEGQYVETLTGHMDLTQAISSSFEYGP
ncbi:GerMN domain-containing protein [Desulfitibacter alkalitolerans]|uniref:GerMN domain-containing protein n=1 Tax=Desulfitibacter alkalitolerans TaxID=264641 RepID=UPI0006886EA2|nr:GerMN domain-containing protein [Desulfitibacter alkalitolerans]